MIRFFIALKMLLLTTSLSALDLPLRSDFWAWTTEVDLACARLGYSPSISPTVLARSDPQTAANLDTFWKRGWSPEQAAAYIVYTP